MKLKILQSTVRGWLTTKQSGFSLVEIILALAILALLTVALIGNFIYSQESAVVAGAKSRAAFLAEEGLEATRNIRDADFANLVDGNYGLTTSSNQWVFSGTQDVTDIYTRQIQISTPSANRKQIISQVTWQQTAQRTGTISLTTYLTNWIATAGIGNWALPTQQAVYNASGNQDGWKITVSGNYAYMVRLDGTPDFLIIDISNLASPTLVGSLSLTGIPQAITVSGNYAYVGSRQDNQDLQIIDISNPSLPTVAGTYDAAGSNDVVSIVINGTTAYLARTFDFLNREIVVVDVTNPAAVTLVGSLNLAGTASDIVLIGSYLYVSNYNTSGELYVVDVSTPATPLVTATLNLTGNSTGLSIAGAGNVVFVGRTGGEVRAVDVSTPASPLQMGTYAAGASVTDLSLGNSNNYLFLTNTGASNGFRVLDVTNPNSITQVGSINLPGGANAGNGIFYDATLDRSFVVGATNSSELIILQPS
jgi:prepilin-type N-terminal cleavage/methylation domain-containing protein